MLVALYKCLNEVDYIGYSLRSVYPFVDRIVIMEVCDPYMMEANPECVTMEGLSTDGMDKVINSFPDPLNKIDYHRIGLLGTKGMWPDEELGEAFSSCLAPGDWAINIDGDEIWPIQLWDRILTLMDYRKPSPGHINIKKLCLWHDFDHEITQQTTGCWNNTVEICRKVPSGKFWFAGGDLGMHLFGTQGDTVNVWDPPILHYSYARNPEKTVIHQRWLNWNRWDFLAGSREAQCLALDGKKFTFDQWIEHQVYFTNDYDWVNGIYVKKFEGKHPDFMQESPLYKGLKWNGGSVGFKDEWKQGLPQLITGVKHVENLGSNAPHRRGRK